MFPFVNAMLPRTTPRRPTGNRRRVQGRRDDFRALVYNHCTGGLTETDFRIGEALQAVCNEKGDSHKAAQASLKALEGIGHDAGGDHEAAATAHVKAARAHEAAATQARVDGNMRQADRHDKAAALHRRAASIHQAAPDEDDDADADSEEATENLAANLSWMANQLREEDRERAARLDILPVPGSAIPWGESGSYAGSRDGLLYNSALAGDALDIPTINWSQEGAYSGTGSSGYYAQQWGADQRARGFRGDSAPGGTPTPKGILWAGGDTEAGEVPPTRSAAELLGWSPSEGQRDRENQQRIGLGSDGEGYDDPADVTIDPDLSPDQADYQRRVGKGSRPATGSGRAQGTQLEYDSQDNAGLYPREGVQGTQAEAARKRSGARPSRDHKPDVLTGNVSPYSDHHRYIGDDPLPCPAGKGY